MVRALANPHGADLRAQLARSDFAKLLTRTLEPRLLAGENVHSTRASERPRAVRIAARAYHHCAPPPGRLRLSPLLEQNLTTRFCQQQRQQTAPICRAFDGAYRDRTDDLQLAKLALSQLS